MSERHTTGGCLCGAVRYRIDAPLAPIQICHCGQCRKAQGAPFATNTPVRTATIRWLSGEAAMAEYRASPGKRRVFCSQCGSPLFSQRDATPEVLRLRAGTLDDPAPLTKGFHIYALSAPDWWPLEDELPRYDHAGPDLDPL